ncbi:MAG: glycosyltransferase [Flammeovirgaceae bacterium]
MIDLLVISTASVTAINRNIYIEIKNRGWNVEMVIPTTYSLANAGVIKSQPQRPQDPTINFLELSGSNPRTFYFSSIEKLFENTKVFAVLIESDPVSRMAVHLADLSVRYNFFLFSLSCENLPFDLIPTLKRRGIGSIPSSLIKLFFYWRAKKRINTVFTINNDGTDIFRKKGYNRVIKTPLGFDSEVFFKNEDARNKIRIKLRAAYPVIAYFGRLVEEKGVHLLLEALERIKHLNWHFMLDKFNQGTSSYNQYIQRLIESYDLQDRILFVEADHYEIADYMNAADVVVIPSITTTKWKEQYGRVAPEAMACGKLVVASCAGALPELIEDGGVIFKEGDVGQLAMILTDYLRNPVDYTPIQEIALTRAQQQLSIKKQADIYTDRLKELKF